MQSLIYDLIGVLIYFVLFFLLLFCLIGYLDDIQVYNYILTQSQISLLYTMESTCPTLGLSNGSFCKGSTRWDGTSSCQLSDPSPGTSSISISTTNSQVKSYSIQCN
jgi:hypothetical protein